MNPKMEGDGFPSKVYTIMACERPLLIASSNDTPIVNFLKDKGCAKIVTEKDMTKKVEEMSDWLHHISKEELLQMGRNGRQIILKNYTKEIVTNMYADLINKLIGA